MLWVSFTLFQNSSIVQAYNRNASNSRPESGRRHGRGVETGDIRVPHSYPVMVEQGKKRREMRKIKCHRSSYHEFSLSFSFSSVCLLLFHYLYFTLATTSFPYPKSQNSTSIRKGWTQNRTIRVPPMRNESRIFKIDMALFYQEHYLLR